MLCANCGDKCDSKVNPWICVDWKHTRKLQRLWALGCVFIDLGVFRAFWVVFLRESGISSGNTA